LTGVTSSPNSEVETCSSEDVVQLVAIQRAFDLGRQQLQSLFLDGLAYEASFRKLVERYDSERERLGIPRPDRSGPLADPHRDVRATDPRAVMTTDLTAPEEGDGSSDCPLGAISEQADQQDSLRSVDDGDETRNLPM
jgi:hypothetical protein